MLEELVVVAIAFALVSLTLIISISGKERPVLKRCVRCGTVTEIPANRSICDECLRNPHKPAIPPK